jgi:hypothetical protein
VLAHTPIHIHVHGTLQLVTVRRVDKDLGERAGRMGAGEVCWVDDEGGVDDLRGSACGELDVHYLDVEYHISASASKARKPDHRSDSLQMDSWQAMCSLLSLGGMRSGPMQSVPLTLEKCFSLLGRINTSGAGPSILSKG